MKKSGHGNANWGSQNDVSLSSSDVIGRVGVELISVIANSQEILEGTLLWMLYTVEQDWCSSHNRGSTGVDLARSGDYGRPHSPAEMGAHKVHSHFVFTSSTLWPILKLSWCSSRSRRPPRKTSANSFPNPSLEKMDFTQISLACSVSVKCFDFCVNRLLLSLSRFL